MRACLALVATAVVLGIPAVALAQDDCPPGGWFCEEGTDDEQASNPGETEASEQPAEVALPENGAPQNGSGSNAPAVVVVTPNGAPPPRVVVVDPGNAPPPPPPKRPHYRDYHEWGFNMRLEGVMLGNDEGRAEQSGMAGLGFSFRYRPIPNFAFDFGLDFLGGKDWNGYSRNESALLVNGIVFFNPHDAVQFYTLGGFGFSGAEVSVPTTETIGGYQDTTYKTESYSYFGGQLGLGLEFRLTKRTALNVDLLGFMRSRTDDKAAENPEFVDPADPTRTTNTSGGGLLRGGVTIYW